MTYEQAIRKAFHTQKSDANVRGIPFLFEFDDWEYWWIRSLGPKWFEKRGRKRGQYVMARKGDKGPYAWWNIDCITCSENQKQTSGINHPGAKLTEELVKKIYFAKGYAKDISKRYGVRKYTVLKIKNGVLWSSYTAQFGAATRDVRRAKLTKELIKEIYYSKIPSIELASSLGVNPNTVRRIRNKTGWLSVTQSF